LRLLVKLMTSANWVRKSIAGTVAVAVLAINSLVVLASPAKIAGEILIADRGADVTVNGEVAQSGRSIFSGSTIDTPDNAGAVISLGSAGRLELAPKTSITLNFDENGITGSLNAGKVTVLSSPNKVSITTPTGVSTLAVGESAESGTTQDSTANTKSGNSWWIWAAVFGGAIVGVVIATTSDNNRTSIGGGTTVVSPLR